MRSIIQEVWLLACSWQLQVLDGRNKAVCFSGSYTYWTWSKCTVETWGTHVHRMGQRHKSWGERTLCRVNGWSGKEKLRRQWNHSLHQLRKRRHIDLKSRGSPPPGLQREEDVLLILYVISIAQVTTKGSVVSPGLFQLVGCGHKVWSMPRGGWGSSQNMYLGGT